MTKEKHGIARGLTNYGDADFSLYLRRSFARSMGYSTDLLSRPVIGIADTYSGYNTCHRHFPELIEAVKLLRLLLGRHRSRGQLFDATLEAVRLLGLAGLLIERLAGSRVAPTRP